MALLAMPFPAHANPAAPVSAPLPNRAYANDECISCHLDRDAHTGAAIVIKWRQGPHGPAKTGKSRATCVDCHDATHKGANRRARADQTCIACHEGETTHSYTTSKHGVLIKLGAPSLEKPFRRGEYRAPGCGYCHLHDGDHGDTMDPRRGPAVNQWVCSGCHAPRYVSEHFAAGLRQLTIAGLKLQEGEELIAAAGQIDPSQLARLRQALHRHFLNVALGVGHQSPDYQWWHGQPAIDGDLIRIRAAITRALRQRATLPQ